MVLVELVPGALALLPLAILILVLLILVLLVIVLARGILPGRVLVARGGLLRMDAGGPGRILDRVVVAIEGGLMKGPAGPDGRGHGVGRPGQIAPPPGIVGAHRGGEDGRGLIVELVVKAKGRSILGRARGGRLAGRGDVPGGGRTVEIEGGLGIQGALVATRLALGRKKSGIGQIRPVIGLPGGRALQIRKILGLLVQSLEIAGRIQGPVRLFRSLAQIGRLVGGIVGGGP
jgi:hypothetical protein